jgi:hypothetical protein
MLVKHPNCNNDDINNLSSDTIKDENENDDLNDYPNYENNAAYSDDEQMIKLVDNNNVMKQNLFLIICFILKFRMIIMPP